MSTLIPTPVVLQELMDAASDINTLNDGVKTQAVSPRTRGVEEIVVQITDDPLAPNVAADTADGTTASKLVDSGADFVTAGVQVGYAVHNTTDNTTALVTAVDSATQLSLSADIMISGEAYRVIAPAYWHQKFLDGEWTKASYKPADNERVTYTFPTAGTAANAPVHRVVYPVTAPNNTGNYPPATNA